MKSKANVLSQKGQQQTPQISNLEFKNPRDTEIAKIIEYVKHMSVHKIFDAIHIFGQPGTGKTYSVLKAVQEIDVQHTFINCIDDSELPTKVENVVILDEADCGAKKFQLFDKFIAQCVKQKSLLICLSNSPILQIGVHFSQDISFTQYCDEQLRTLFNLFQPVQPSETFVDFVVAQTLKRGGDARLLDKVAKLATFDEVREVFGYKRMQLNYFQKRILRTFISLKCKVLPLCNLSAEYYTVIDEDLQFQCKNMQGLTQQGFIKNDCGILTLNEGMCQTYRLQIYEEDD